MTNNTVDDAGCFDSLTLLSYAAAVTTTIRLGVAVVVLPTYHPIHVAHQVATLDHLSGVVRSWVSDSVGRPSTKRSRFRWRDGSPGSPSRSR